MNPYPFRPHQAFPPHQIPNLYRVNSPLFTYISYSPGAPYRSTISLICSGL